MFLVPMTRESRDLSRSFDRLFDDAFGGFFNSPAGHKGELAARSPALDVAESERAYTVKLDMPGAKKEDIKVTVEGKRVTVQAESETNKEQKEGDRVIYRERSVASYARSFTLPVDVDQAGATAKLEHGVLTLELPKRGTATATQVAIG
ncbi:MAG: Hsp20/alpha crystallin family protein [Betaproteobacteria bacterium]|jgi:HSP20 family protein|nr:Hsp20/alpha crystallin family protein [Betaproteobacteria bacterium]MCC6248855.1 Hsp20/alpha crystallin family protein [Rubrivivax sp.]MCL4699018.1 Hsp20/alpha crystallin family protein [Burkholderiaceae bacterium]